MNLTNFYLLKKKTCKLKKEGKRSQDVGNIKSHGRWLDGRHGSLCVCMWTDPLVTFERVTGRGGCLTHCHKLLLIFFCFFWRPPSSGRAWKFIQHSIRYARSQPVISTCSAPSVERKLLKKNLLRNIWFYGQCCPIQACGVQCLQTPSLPTLVFVS